MTSRGAGRMRGERGDGAGRGWMDVTGWQQLATMELRQAAPLCGYLWPPPAQWPLPYATSDPTLRAICRSAPCRRPHDLIKCNYHQFLGEEEEEEEWVVGRQVGQGEKNRNFNFNKKKIVQRTVATISKEGGNNKNWCSFNFHVHILSYGNCLAWQI